MFKKIIFVLILVGGLSACQSFHNIPTSQSLPPTTPAEEVVERVVEHFSKKHNHFATFEDAWGGYKMDFTFKAMLIFDEVRETYQYTPIVLQAMETRQLSPSDVISYKKQPFCALNFTLWRITGNPAYEAPFLQESAKMREEVSRSPEGAITHRFETPGRYLLIDYLKEYASRMAKAGFISGDFSYFAQGSQQYQIYRRLLRNAVTGLYHNGRGWQNDAMRLSPGAWSRGHGWLIHGLVETMQYTPKDSQHFRKLKEILTELSNDLLQYQDEQGMWHQLLHLPLADSYPDSSGTGLIAYNFSRALYEGFLHGIQYEKAAQQALKTLRQYVTKEGVVLGSSPGPGPLKSIENYYRKPAPPDEPHGAAAMIFAMSREILLRKLSTKSN